MSKETIQIIGYTVLSTMILFLVFVLGYASALDNTNESCVKTGHFYVKDNVFKCELKD